MTNRSLRVHRPHSPKVVSGIPRLVGKQEPGGPLPEGGAPGHRRVARGAGAIGGAIVLSPLPDAGDELSVRFGVLSDLAFPTAPRLQWCKRRRHDLAGATLFDEPTEAMSGRVPTTG